MLSRTLLTLALLLPSSAVAQSSRTELDKGRQAYAKHQYAEALDHFRAAGQAAVSEENDSARIESLKLLAAILRESGDIAQAEQILQDASTQYSTTRGESSLEVAAISEELASLYRAQGRSEQALPLLDKAIAIRDARPESPRIDLARDLMTAAALRQQAGQKELSIELFKRAIQEWDAANPGDSRCLPALESLASIYRDGASYAESEPLLVRALKLREASSGPAHSEVISAVDSLAYVEFGLRKMPEAEGLYKRLLTLWESNAGPDHPMVALTHDKIAEFYAFQQRYEEAEQHAAAALAIRTRVEVASLHQNGRLLIMQAKIPEAEDLYRRTIQIGDLAKAPDDAMDPPLRVYAKILRELKRDAEAEPLEKRVKDALMKQPEQTLPPSKPTR